MSESALAKRIEERHGALRSHRQPWDSLWSEIARFVMPRRTPGLNGTIQSPGSGNEALLFDTTAVRANMTLANGQLAWMSPLESPWFAFEPQGESDEAKLWLGKATNTAREELAISNFYTAIHEAYLDRGAFGTCAIYVEPGRKNLVNVKVLPVGSFVIDEDEEGNVDTLIRETMMTPRQAIQKFGEEYVSPKIRAAVKEPAKANERLRFLHSMYPREDADRDKAKMDGRNMPIASVYLECDSCHICRESGYEEQPFMVSRYLEWGSGMGSLYGWSPSFAALPDARQLNFLQKMMDALAEKAAFPPVLAPDELEGEIDPNAMGVTYFSQDLATAARLPREWMTTGRYDIGAERIKEKQQAINDAFHTDLFQMFAQIEKQMTAREVAERSQEKLIQFSPTFARLTNELFNPLLERIFAILYRAGKFGAVPPQLQGQPYRVQYSSRIALALRSAPSIGYARTLERLAMIAPLVPDVLDNINFDAAERATELADGVPPEFLRSEQDRDEMRKQRAAAQAEAQKQEQLAQQADALGKVGRIPAGSPVGNVIQSGIPEAA
jgi:hypothetical protein